MLNLIVFAKKKMRKITTFRFLLYLSVIDILVLLTGVTDILMKEMFHFEIRNYSDLVCRFHTFLTYSVTQVSSILLMVVSIHRAIDVVSLNVFTQKKSSTSTERSELSGEKGAIEFKFNTRSFRIGLKSGSFRQSKRRTKSHSNQPDEMGPNKLCESTSIRSTRHVSVFTDSNSNTTSFANQTKYQAKNRCFMLLSKICLLYTSPSPRDS